MRRDGYLYVLDTQRIESVVGSAPPDLMVKLQDNTICLTILPQPRGALAAVPPHSVRLPPLTNRTGMVRNAGVFEYVGVERFRATLDAAIKATWGRGLKDQLESRLRRLMAPQP